MLVDFRLSQLGPFVLQKLVRQPVSDPGFVDGEASELNSPALQAFRCFAGRQELSFGGVAEKRNSDGRGRVVDQHVSASIAHLRSRLGRECLSAKDSAVGRII